MVEGGKERGRKIIVSLLAFAAQIDGPYVHHGSTPGDVEKVKEVYRWIAVGNDEFQNLPDFEFSPGAREGNLPVFISPPFIDHAETVRMKDRWSPPMVIEGLQSRVHSEKTGMVGADYRSQEGEGRGEFFKFIGVLGTADLKILGVHKGIGTGLQVGKFANLTVYFVGSGPTPGENLSGNPVFLELAEDLGRLTQPAQGRLLSLLEAEDMLNISSIALNSPQTHG